MGQSWITIQDISPISLVRIDCDFLPSKIISNLKGNKCLLTQR